MNFQKIHMREEIILEKQLHCNHTFLAWCVFIQWIEESLQAETSRLQQMTRISMFHISELKHFKALADTAIIVIGSVGDFILPGHEISVHMQQGCETRNHRGMGPVNYPHLVCMLAETVNRIVATVTCKLLFGTRGESWALVGKERGQASSTTIPPSDI